jgi:hypothetical protein
MRNTTTSTKGNIMNNTETYATDTNYTLTDLAPVTIGSTTYRVELQNYTGTDGQTIWFYGRKDSVFMVRPFRKDPTSAVLVSWKTGNEMRNRAGANVILTIIGDIIEVH